MCICIYTYTPRSYMKEKKIAVKWSPKIWFLVVGGDWLHTYEGKRQFFIFIFLFFLYQRENYKLGRETYGRKWRWRRLRFNGSEWVSMPLQAIRDYYAENTCQMFFYNFFFLLNRKKTIIIMNKKQIGREERFFFFVGRFSFTLVLSPISMSRLTRTNYF